MTITKTDLQIFQSQNMPQDGSSLCGGPIGTTQITGATIGEVFTSSITQANAFGGAVNTRYEKIFAKNANATSNLNSSVIYIDNLLLDVTGTGVMTVVSSSVSDTSSFQCFSIGFDTNGNPQTETLPMNGLTPVQGIIKWGDIRRVLFQAASNNGLTPANGNISISVGGVTLGIIPYGDYAATGEISIGLASAVNDSQTTPNTVTAPTGITFSKPNTFASALMVPGNVLASGSAIGIWVELVVKAGTTVASDVQTSVDIVGVPA